MPWTSSPEQTLIKGLKDLSISIKSEQVNAFMAYLRELKRWNNAYNLTSLKADKDIVIRHFIDSLLYLGAIPKGDIKVMDVGSGAGFPGVPLKIVRPEIRLYLVEPSWKKAGFLMHIVKTLGLEDVEVIEKRVEDVSGLKVEVILTRALFETKDFYKKASPLLREGGRLVLSKGPKVDKEIKELNEKIRFEILRMRLPLTGVYRNIVVLYPDLDLKTDSYVGKVTPSLIKKDANICFNLNCRLRKAGCRGFEGCPGFKTKA